MIDLETIVSPGVCSLLHDSSLAEEQVVYSVLRSGMVGLKLKFSDQVIDMSGMGDGGSFVSPVLHPSWEHINTDAMIFSYKTVSANMTQKNKVFLDGVCIKSKDFVEDLVIGFRTMYHFLFAHRSQLLARGSIFDQFGTCPIRFVFRPSQTYARQLRRLARPEFFHTGVNRWIDLQIFKKTWLKKRMDARLWIMADAELNALERLDIPWFGTRAESTSVFTDEGITIENSFDQSALIQIQSCLTSLSKDDLQQQILSIHEAFAEV